MARLVTRKYRDELRIRSDDYQSRYDLGADMYPHGFSLGPSADPFCADGWADAKLAEKSPK